MTRDTEIEQSIVKVNNGNAQRVRKYRLKTLNEKKKLEEELVKLQEIIIHLYQHRPEKKNPFKMANEILLKANKQLQQHVNNQQEVVMLLSTWFASQIPPQKLPMESRSSDFTLLAHPVARRQGARWLVDRQYYTGLAAYATDRPLQTMEDTAICTVRSTYNDDHGLIISESELWSQLTICAPLIHTSNAFWQRMRKYELLSQSCEEMDKNCFYLNSMRVGPQSVEQIVTSRYETSDRVFIATTSVFDEKEPVATSLYRGRSIKWTIFEKVTESITLMRHIAYHLTPVISNRPASMEEMGGFIGMPSEPTAYPQTYLEQYRSRMDVIALQWLDALHEFIHHIESDYENNADQ